MDKIKVIIKKPGDEPYEAEIESGLDKMQEIVGGYIEPVFASVYGVALVGVVNEEGRIMGLTRNCFWNGCELVGPVFWCGVSGEDFADVPISLDQLKAMIC